MTKYLFVGQLAWLIFVPFAALAADEVDTLPANAEIASQVEFLKDLNKQPLQIQETPEIQQEEPASQTPDSADTLFVKKIIFEGNQTIASAELYKTVAGLENSTVTFKQLKEAINQITALYRSRGYLLSRAYLPPQKIQNGEILIQIIEGRAGKVSVEENRWFNDRVYTNYFRSINNSKTFQYGDMETALYFLNQKEDRQAKAYLEPGAEAGTTDITLRAKEVFPLHLNYEFNNRGTKFTNRARHMLNFSATNFLGFDDSLYGGLSMAEQAAFRAAWMQYAFPVRSTGTEFGLNWSVAKTHLTKDLRAFDIEGDYFELTPSITQDLIRRRTFNLSLFAGFEIKDSKSTIANQKTSFERMRVIRTGPRMNLQDRYGKTMFSSDIHIGLGNFMGSLEKDSPNSSRLGAGGNFVYYSGSLARLQRMPLNSFLILKTEGQWSPVTLASLEQFRAGGMTSVRGYSESDSSGDRGYVASAELNFPVPFVPHAFEIPYIRKKFNEVFRLVGFYDLGQTAYRSRRGPTEEKNRFLMGTGFGTRLNFGNYFNLQMDVGFPIGNESVDKDRPQIHLSVKAGF